MRNFLKIILANLIVFILCILVFEIVLRLSWRMSALEGEFYITSRNRILRYELKPNISKGNISINSDNFRDKQYPLLKPARTFRIIVLGDSETFAKSLPLDETFPKKLEYFINQGCRGLDFEVLNMGVEGYNTIQEFEFLKYKGLKYKPDLVILNYCFNDPDYPEYYCRKNFLNRHFLLARYIQYRIKKARVKLDRKLKHINSEVENFRYLYTTESWDYTKEAILEIAKFLKKENIKFVLTVVLETSSSVSDFKEGFPYSYINEKLASFCVDNKIEIIDPLYIFKKREDKPLDLVISFEDRHKNAFATSVIASYVKDELVKRKIIPCKN